MIDYKKKLCVFFGYTENWRSSGYEFSTCSVNLKFRQIMYMIFFVAKNKYFDIQLLDFPINYFFFLDSSTPVIPSIFHSLRDELSINRKF